MIVVCHEPGRTHVIGHPELAMPTVEHTIDLNLTMGRRTNPAIRCSGVSFNTSQLSDAEAQRLMAEQGRAEADVQRRLMASESQRLGLPVADPVRGGEEFERLLDNCLRGSK